MSDLVVTAPAKINLFLGVGSLRPDRFHDVITIMHALELADTVRLRPADELAVICDTDLGIPADENLAFRAARAFSETYGVDVLVDIEIEKRIPAGAGLGGGSADAAAVLAGLAHWAALPLDHGALVAIARSLGADCAFMLLGGPALMRGRGDEFGRSLPAICADIVLLKPDASVPTAAAYRAFDASPVAVGAASGVADALRFQDRAALATSLGNNLTAAAESLVPEIAAVRGWLGEQEGVSGVLLAGSGSSVFGLCEDTQSAERAARGARERGWWAMATKTRASGVQVAEEGADG